MLTYEELARLAIAVLLASFVGAYVRGFFEARRESRQPKRTLHGSHGFTQADVDLLRRSFVNAEGWSGMYPQADPDETPRLRELADRIAALLPPREDANA